MRFRYLKSDTSIRCSVFHAVWEKSQHVFWGCFVMVGDSWAVHNRFFASIQLKKEYSGESLICFIIKLDLKGHSDILGGSKHPEFLILSIIDLTWLKISFLVKHTFHRLSYWCREEVSLKLSKFGRNFIANLISFLSYNLVLCSDLLSLLLTHGLFDLYKID